MEADLGVELAEGNIELILQAMANSKAVGTDGRPGELLKLELNRPLDPPGTPLPDQDHLARMESPTVVERCHHYGNPQERQDRMW